jgi:hypothetical protein
MRHYRKTAPRWNQVMQQAAAATSQARRDADPKAPRDDCRPALTLRIGPDDGPPLVNWRLTPIKGQIRRYRVTVAGSGEMVHDEEGRRVGGGKDAILRAAAKLLPNYLALDSLE